MNKFNNGYIYKIYNDIGTYYGSSCNKYLCNRVGRHRADYRENKGCYSRLLGDDKTWKYEIVEHYPCNNKSELNLREAFWIKNNICVNKIIPGRTKKEYYLDNKDRLDKLKKIYADNRKDITREYDRIRRSKKTNCECGGIYSPNHKNRHLKSKKHINYLL